MSEEGWRERGPTVEAGTSLKCQRHHNSRGAKQRLLAGLKPAKKPARPSGANKNLHLLAPILPPCTRLYVGGEDGKIERENEPRCLSSERPQKSSARQKNNCLSLILLGERKIYIYISHVEKLCEVNDVSWKYL